VWPIDPTFVKCASLSLVSRTLQRWLGPESPKDREDMSSRR